MTLAKVEVEELVEEIISDPTSEPIAELVEEIQPEQKQQLAVATNSLAPFYLSAGEYLELRGSKAAPYAVYNYNIVTKALAEDAEEKTRKVSLMLGTDYVALTSGSSKRIYDFKLNRLLTLTPEYGHDGKKTGAVLFDNVSLYARAYRNTAAVLQATSGGKNRSLTIAKGQTLDAFWVESAMSWAAQELESPLMVTSEEDTLEIRYDGAPDFHSSV